MSATNRSDVRIPSDFYPTPAWCVRRLLEAVNLPGGNWLDPGAGNGAIIDAVNCVRQDVTWAAIDIRPEVEPYIVGAGANFMAADFLTLGYDKTALKFDVIITNPPYSLAQGFIEKSLQMANHVAMLLRLNYLAGGKRVDFMRAMPPDVYVLPNRPSFTGQGTDATEYAWFVWRPIAGRSCGNLRVLPATPKSERCSGGEPEEETA